MKSKYFILTIVLLSVIIMGRAGASPPIAHREGDYNTYELVNFNTDGDDPGLEVVDQNQNKSTYLTVGDIFIVVIINSTVVEREVCDTNGNCFFIEDSILLQIQFDDCNEMFVSPVYTGFLITTDLEFINKSYEDYPGSYNITETDETVTIWESITNPNNITLFERESIYHKQTGWELEYTYTITIDGVTTSAEIRSIGIQLKNPGILQFELPIFVFTCFMIVMLRRHGSKVKF